MTQEERRDSLAKQWSKQSSNRIPQVTISPLEEGSDVINELMTHSQPQPVNNSHDVSKSSPGTSSGSSNVDRSDDTTELKVEPPSRACVTKPVSA